MNKMLLLSFIVLSSVTCASAGTLYLLNSREYTAGYDDYATDITVDKDGNVIVAGMSTDGEVNHVSIVKYDNALNELYSAQYPVESYAEGVATDDSGNIYVTGKIWVSSWDVFTVKYSPDLSVVMDSATLDGPAMGGDIGWDISVDRDGNIIVVGETDIISGFYDFLVVKYSPSLVKITSATINGPTGGNDYAYGVATDASGNIYITGKTHTGVTFDCFTVKCDNSLVKISSAVYGDPDNGEDSGNSIALDSSGNIIVAGDSPVSGNMDFFMVKYDKDFNLLASQSYNGTLNDQDNCNGVITDPQDGIIVTGGIDGTAAQDICTLRYGPDLAPPPSSDKVDGTNDDRGRAVATDANGNIFVTGETYNGLYYHFLTLKYNGPPVITYLNPDNSLTDNSLDVTIAGSNFLPGASVAFSGTGITVNSVSLVSSSQIDVNLTVAKDASSGLRAVTVANSDGASETKTAAFKVIGDIAEEPGDIKIIGSGEGKGVVNPDKGDAALIYFKGISQGRYTLRIFNVLGELVYEESKDSLSDGMFSWIPGDIASGTYIVSIQGPGINMNTKIAILR